MLRGAIGSWSELARALTGDWQLVTPHPPANPAGPWSDAESQATLGLAALALAALMPRRRPLRRAWLGCWLAALTGVALSLRVVNEPLLDAFPQAGLFHDRSLSPGMGFSTAFPTRPTTSSSRPSRIRV